MQTRLPRIRRPHETDLRHSLVTDGVPGARARRAPMRQAQLSGQFPHARLDVGLNVPVACVLWDGAQHLLRGFEPLSGIMRRAEGLLGLAVFRREIGWHGSPRK